MVHRVNISGPTREQGAATRAEQEHTYKAVKLAAATQKPLWAKCRHAGEISAVARRRGAGRTRSPYEHAWDSDQPETFRSCSGRDTADFGPGVKPIILAWCTSAEVREIPIWLRRHHEDRSVSNTSAGASASSRLSQFAIQGLSPSSKGSQMVGRAASSASRSQGAMPTTAARTYEAGMMESLGSPRGDPYIENEKN